MYNGSKKHIEEGQYVTIPEIAVILGLKYHHTRKMLLGETSLGFYDYNGKKVWVLDDILRYKKTHFKKGIVGA